MAASQKVCVVFGFGPGIGAACARKWIQQGFKVAICSRSAEKLKTFEEKYSSGETKGYPCDVTNREQMDGAVKKIEKELGPIHTVVYNAGSAMWKTYRDMTDSDLDMCLNTNLRGLVIAAQLICPKMEERGEGVVAVTGASASLRGKPFTAAFAPAKSAQRIFAQSLARDVGPKNVHVFYAINDGLIDSNEEVGKQEEGKIDPNAIAETYWNVAAQPKNCWTFEIDMRPNIESW